MPGVAATNMMWVTAVTCLRRAAYWALHYFTVGSYVRLSTFADVRVIWTFTMDARLHAVFHSRTGSMRWIKARNFTQFIPPTWVACAWFAMTAVVTTSMLASITFLGRTIWTYVSCKQEYFNRKTTDILKSLTFVIINAGAWFRTRMSTSYELPADLRTLSSLTWVALDPIKTMVAKKAFPSRALQKGCMDGILK